MFTHWFTALIASAASHPLWQALIVVLATFVLEDAATVLAALQAQSGGMPIPYALGALYSGIVLGDLGLYGLGRLAAHFQLFARFRPQDGSPLARGASSAAWIQQRVTSLVFTSRFLPGARLPTYTTCGYVHAPFVKFMLAAIGATLIWTSLLFALSVTFGALVLPYLGAWRWLGIAVLVIGIVGMSRHFARQHAGAGTGRS